ncbi:MAG: phenylalanine--tRNA ligase subunit alpha [Alphaproteobacteria bacterium]|nr:phenylalanine--tRNA ligase subunit alpha [Alphaproteobacteria bacterium]
MSAIDQLPAIEAEILAAITSASDEAALDAIRVAELGKKGRISLLMRELGTMSPEQRQTAGPALNGARDRLAEAVSARKLALERAALDQRLLSEREDLTLPSRPEPQGALHPVMQVFEEVAAIFADMGFSVAEGPDIEDDFHNFTALNFPPGHPAREMHDTFFLKPAADGTRKVLRTHTSPVQIRTMLSQKPPIRIIAPGRVYRKDWDATHTPMFHQVEGLVIDKVAHMGHLKSCLTEFCARFFEVERAETRLRPHFFPFTEPSAEMDVRCDRQPGKDGVGAEIRVGVGDSWLEILGCGMVHPSVLKSCGIDPDEHQGFAFGMGVDRLAMLKYGMPDLRPYFEADVDWIRHYGFKPWLLPTVTGGLS